MLLKHYGRLFASSLNMRSQAIIWQIFSLNRVKRRKRFCATTGDSFSARGSFNTQNSLVLTLLKLRATTRRRKYFEEALKLHPNHAQRISIFRKPREKRKERTRKRSGITRRR